MIASRTPSARPWREAVVSAALAGAVAALIATLGPSPEDAPAQLYRSLLARRGFWVWDNLWYGGHYPVSYGPLFGFTSVVVGDTPLVLAGIVLASGLFALIAVREFGPAARWPARVFGLLAAAPMFTGLESYSLGLTALLGSLAALQGRRLLPAALLSVVTLLFSPLAFAFLCILLIAVRVTGRGSRRATALTGAAALLAGGMGAALLTAFPNGGVYPFHGWDLAAVLSLCVTTSCLAWPVRAGRPIAAIFALWGLCCLAAYVIPSPVGANVTRLREAALPLALLVALLARFRPRWLAALALGLAAANTLGPYLLQIRDQIDARPAHPRFWTPTLRYLHDHLGLGYRVEVVPTAAHWEAYWVPQGGYPLARGWFRQLDPRWLYDDDFGARRYVSWLRGAGVRLVVLPHTALDAAGAAHEASVVRSVPRILPIVASGPTATIYALRRPTPILTGRGPSKLLVFSHDSIAGEVASPGAYLLRVHFMPYWRVSGSVCLMPAPGGQTALVARRPGRFRLVANQSVAGLVDGLLDDLATPSCTAPR